MSPLKALTIAESVLSHSTIRAYTEDTSLSDVPDHVLDDFVSMGETKHLREQLDRIEFNIKREAESGRKTKLKMSPRDEKQYRWVQRRLGEAKLRDRLTEARRGLGEAYADCWCLGRGGRDKVALGVRYGPPGDQSTYVSSDPYFGWNRYCPCPDGIAAEAEAKAAREKVLDEVKRRHMDQLIGAAKIPLRYRGLSFATWEDEAVKRGATLEETRAVRKTLLTWSTDAASPIDSSVRPRMLVLAGAAGAGKTSIAAVIAQSYLDRRKSVIFRVMGDLIDELREAYRARGQEVTERALIEAYTTADLLVIDDLGSEDLTNDQSKYLDNLLYRILDTRSTNSLPTILTTNLPSSELAQRLSSRVMERIVPSTVSYKIRLMTPDLREVADVIAF